MDTYRSIESLPTKWLEDVGIEVVTRGNDHPAPRKTGQAVQIYMGTIYQVSLHYLKRALCSILSTPNFRQLYNFTKQHSMDVDCVIIDEAGQMSLGSISLVLRSLASDGRIIIAGDSEQLAPILSAQYPLLKTHALFGSVLDCLMFGRSWNRADKALPVSPTEGDESEPTMSQGSIIQLTENFRYAPEYAPYSPF